MLSDTAVSMIIYIDLSDHDSNTNKFLFVPMCVDLAADPKDKLDETLNFAMYRDGTGFCSMPSYSRVTMFVSVSFCGYEYHKEIPMDVEFTDYGSYRVMWREFVLLHACLHLGEERLLHFFDETATGLRIIFNIYKDLRKIFLHLGRTKFIGKPGIISREINIDGDMFRLLEERVPKHVLFKG